jgi:hypothetical protein
MKTLLAIRIRSAPWGQPTMAVHDCQAEEMQCAPHWLGASFHTPWRTCWLPGPQVLEELGIQYFRQYRLL